MAPALAGLREMQRTLARVQAATLADMPAGTQSPCDLADYVYAPGRSLAHGLPIQERGQRDSRSLVDFAAEHPVAASLFVVPEDYVQMALPGMSLE